MSEDPGERVPVAVLGAGGYVGQTFVARLAEHPWFELVALTGGPRSAGRRIGEIWQRAEPPPAGIASRKIERLGPAALARRGVRIAFGALPSGTAAPIERALARRGVGVFTNSSDLRGSPGVPLLVPEVNPDQLGLVARRPRGTAPIVTNPNCTATGLALALASWRARLRPRTVHVTTYQALSGAGHPGVPSLDIADNVVPFIEHEEPKVELETRRLLGTLRPDGSVAPAAWRTVAQCARVATREGHLEAVTIEARGSPTLPELRRAIERFDPLGASHLPSAPHPPVAYRPEPDRPQPLRDRDAGGPGASSGMTVSVGRMRWEPPYLRCFLLVNNVVRGGAGGSILNAEFARAAGVWPD